MTYHCTRMFHVRIFLLRLFLIYNFVTIFAAVLVVTDFARIYYWVAAIIVVCRERHCTFNHIVVVSATAINHCTTTMYYVWLYIKRLMDDEALMEAEILSIIVDMANMSVMPIEIDVRIGAVFLPKLNL